MRANKEVERLILAPSRRKYTSHCTHLAHPERQNTKPAALRSRQVQIQPAVTAYTCAPGIVGLKGWLAPQARIFPLSAMDIPEDPSAASTHSPPKTQPVGYSTEWGNTGREPVRTVQGSPLRVRKTRENLRQLHHQADDSCHGPGPTSARGGELPAIGNGAASVPLGWDDRHIKPTQSSGDHVLHHQNEYLCYEGGFMGLELGRDDPATAKAGGLPTNRVVQRRKSVRKRVVSRVKEGILSRSRSTAKPLDVRSADGSATRTRSAANNQDDSLASAPQPQPSRNSGDEIAQSSTCTSSSAYLMHKSDSLIRVGNNQETSQPAIESLANLLVKSHNGRTSTLSSHSSGHRRRTTPSPSYSPSPDKTPRPARKPEQAVEHRLGASGPLHMQISTFVSSDTIDLSEERTVWVMVDAKAAINAKVRHVGTRGGAQFPNCTQAALNIVIVLDNSLSHMSHDM